MARVLALSSQVSRGAVGLSASVPALQWLGHEVWALPTILLASRPGMGRLERLPLDGSDLARLLGALEADGTFGTIDGVLCGYFPSPGAVAAAAQAVARIKAANPKVVVLCDPVLGDNGQLYIAPATAGAIRDTLLPLATVTTPNLFELGWLTGRSPHTAEMTATCAHRLGVPSVVVTSAARNGDTLTTTLVTPDTAQDFKSVFRERLPNGTGDLLAGLLLGYLLDALPLPNALGLALAALDRVAVESQGRDALDLAALAATPRVPNA
jgi:pyridoxine kinase